METWQWIVAAVLGLSFIGDIVLHVAFPHRRRIDNAGADMASAQHV